MKKLAIKGLLGVAVAVALCMFFSGTIKTISTAKVKLVSAKTGKLEEKIDLSGKLLFPETEEIALDGLTADRSVTIKRVRVTVGREVEEGDVLFEAEITGYDAELAELEKEYDTAQSELMELERKNANLRLKRTEETWIEAYDALAEAKRAVRKAKTALEVGANLAEVVLENGLLPEDADDDKLLDLQNALLAAQEAEASAQAAFDTANRVGISEETLAYVTKTRELRDAMADAQEEISALTVLSVRAAQIVAPHDGFVVEVNVKAGDTYNGSTPAIIMNAKKSKGVMRADVSEIERTIAEDTAVTMQRSNGKTLSAEVSDTGVDAEGKRYIDVELSDKEIENLGGAATLMSRETEMVINYRAGTSTTLLPVSAVRGTGEERYVYIVNERSNALGERTLTVSKMNVTVITEVGATASIEEDLSRQRVAYMEDRAIAEGSQVMTYPE